MKKGIFVMTMVLCLAMVIVAGCGSSSPTTVGPTPTPTPTPINWPAASSTYTTLSSTAHTVAGNPDTGAFSKMEVKSDSSNLYVKLTLSSTGTRNLYLLIDDVKLTSGYNINRWEACWGTWWGDMDVSFLDSTSTAFFDLDFSYVDWRGDAGDLGVGSASAVAFNGPDEGSTTSQASNITVNDSTDHLTYEFVIPFSSIGTGASAGDHVQIIALLGKETWMGSTEAEKKYHTPENDPSGSPYDKLGIKSVIPGDDAVETTDTTVTPNVVRINKIGSTARYTL